jgi:hypothetical protein
MYARQVEPSDPARIIVYTLECDPASVAALLLEILQDVFNVSPDDALVYRFAAGRRARE